MALLHRFTQLNDRFNTGIFTFIVTKSVVRDPHRDATTKDFIYGYHRWAITFTRANEKALGVYLILRNPCSNSKCYADYSFTLLNKEHFSKNESISDKQVLFTVERPAQGVGKWILLTDIASRKFSDESGEFLLELSLSNILTIFELDLNVPNIQTLQRNFKLETTSIQFGGFDWNLWIKPQESDINNEEFINLNEQTAVNVFLHRLTSHDRLVRVKYRLFLGNCKRKEDSGILDQISYDEGRIVGTQVNLFNLIETAKANKNTIKFYFEMFCANLISESKVSIVREQTPATNCYDRNKQGWSIEADLANKYLQLKLFFMDLESVPKNHLRFISFNLYVISKNCRNDTRESISVLNSPHSNYYITDHIDVGVSIDTDIESQNILKVSPKDYLENETYLTVHIEWIDSIMLFNHLYHKYDDLSRIHCHQMRREIAALYSENNALERQLFSYQKSISGVSSDRRGTPPMNSGLQYSGMQPSGHQSNVGSMGNSTQHRVSDPYILDNLTAPFNSLINKASSHQIVSTNHPSPGLHSKGPHQNASSTIPQQPSQIKTGQHQPIHQSSSSHQAQPQSHPQSAHQSQFPHVTQQPNANMSNLNKNTSLTNLQQNQPTSIHQQTTQSQQQQQQINTLNSSIANMNMQPNYGVAQSNNSPTLTSMQQHYQLQQQQQQMNLNQMSQMNQMNWQAQPNINSMMHLSSVNRSTSHLAQMNPVTTTINTLGYNTNQLANSSNMSNASGMTNEMNNQLAGQQQLSAGQPLSRHLSNSTCNLNQANYVGSSNLVNANAGLASNSNAMNNLNKPMSSSNHNLNTLNQSNAGLIQYTQNGQRYTAQQSNQLPNHYRQPLQHQQPMMPRNMYDDQRMYQQQSNLQPKSPLYSNNELNYS